MNTQTAVAVPEIMPLFDYGDMPPDVVVGIECAAEKFHATEHEWRKITTRYVVEQGRLLRDVRKRLAHGQFLQWIEQRLGVYDQTARNYMNAADLADKSQTVLDLPVATIYKIAGPTTPPELQQEIIAKMESGEGIKPREIVAQIDAAKKKIAEEKAEAKAAKNAEQRAVEKARQKKARAEYERRCAKQEAERGAKEMAEYHAAREAIEFLEQHLGDKLPTFAKLYKAAGYFVFKSAMDKHAIEKTTDQQHAA